MLQSLCYCFKYKYVPIIMLLLQEKENPEYLKDLKKAEVEYEKKRDRLQVHYGIDSFYCYLLSYSLNP